MKSGSTEPTKYSLRELPDQDYCRQLQGPSISLRALTTTVKEGTQGKTNMTTELDWLIALMAQLAQHQDKRDQQEEERWQREEERQRREEEHQQQEKEYRQERQQREEERRQREEEYRREQAEYRQKQEEYHRQQDERHQEQLAAMQEQHRQQLEALRERKPTTDSLLRMTPFQENEDIQDFLEAFEG